MTKIKYILISLIFLLIISCSKNITEKKVTIEKTIIKIVRKKYEKKNFFMNVYKFNSLRLF